MGKPAVNMGAGLACTFGMAPSTLVVLPMGPPVFAEKKFAATIMDHLPIANIPPFGVCTSIANPVVAAATAAALGVLTPMPCVPATASPWVPGDPTVLINSNPALVAGSQCICNWGGIISITMPGTTQTMT